MMGIPGDPFTNNQTSILLFFLNEKNNMRPSPRFPGQCLPWSNVKENGVLALFTQFYFVLRLKSVLSVLLWPSSFHGILPCEIIPGLLQGPTCLPFSLPKPLLPGLSTLWEETRGKIRAAFTASQ